MFRTRAALLFVVTLLGLVIASAACSGSGDDDDDAASETPTVTPNPDPNPLAGSILEIEPNDDQGDATAVTSSGATFAFHGRCEATGDQDWFSFVPGSGGFAADLTWDERVYIPDPHVATDLDLYVSDSSGELASDDSLSPGDSPAQVNATMTSAGALYLLVDCFQADDDQFYQGTLTP
jgi:hypothetical protein